MWWMVRNAVVMEVEQEGGTGTEEESRSDGVWEGGSEETEEEWTELGNGPERG